MKIRYFGPFGFQSGYSDAMQNYLMALHRYSDVELDIVPMLDTKTENIHPRFHDLIQHVGKHISNPNWPDVVISHTLPSYVHEFVSKDLTPPHGVKKIGMTTWETDSLPKFVVDRINPNFDKVIVPSYFNLDVFSECLDIPVARVPHCFDTDFWPKPSFTAKLERRRRTNTYNFLWVGAWTHRKNPINIIKSFFHIFDKNDDVKLTLLAAGCNGALVDLNMLKICSEVNDLPNVEVLTKRLSDEELVQLHMNNDCYVSTHRGEGFGLGAFESAICGNPIIATGYGGMLDFMRGNDFKVGYSFTPAVVDPDLAATEIDLGQGVTIKKLVKLDPTGINIRQKWAEPDLIDFAESMYEAYESQATRDPDETNSLRQEFCYESVAKLLVEEITDTLNN